MTYRTNATQLGEIYDTALIYARAAAFSCGYALAVHGSELRDLDLIAAPWTDDATNAETLIDKILELTGGRIGDSPGTPRPTVVGHGRSTSTTNTC